MNYTIRNATPADLPEIIKLCAEHAAYEKAEYSGLGKAENLNAIFFLEMPKAFCLIVENESGILGYATYSFEFSTWDAEFYTHMDCLYLRDNYRGFGIGEALIKEIAKAAKANGCTVLQWQTPVFNERAIKFYYKVGATSKEKLRLYLNETTINNLAK
ncbi:MAG: GNAT family N-acetyltransferase [Bacteroidia bacterium]|nr:GNAT family N-acetyltransferase [Bacteroidia bacterium]